MKIQKMSEENAIKIIKDSKKFLECHFVKKNYKMVKNTKYQVFYIIPAFCKFF